MRRKILPPEAVWVVVIDNGVEPLAVDVRSRRADAVTYVRNFVRFRARVVKYVLAKGAGR